MTSRLNRHSFVHVLPLFVVLLAACGAEAGPNAVPVHEPLEGWDEQVRLTEAVDEASAPDVVELTLEARVARVEVEPGHDVELWTYNGRSPGPMIRAHVGDTLRVHFTNRLPEPTTIHWHGVEVSAAMDGAGHDGYGVVEPGESFEYEFVIPHAGLYWYHPHVNSSAQVARGLYGALLVEDRSEPEFGAETVLMVDDISFDDSGELTSPDDNGEFGDFFGREGEVMLVNGKVMPTLRARSGDALRLRVVNSATSRYFRLALDGHHLTRVGGDGGLLEQPEARADLLLVPGERADLVVRPQGKVGDKLLLRSAPYSRFLCGSGLACAEQADLLQIEIVEGEGHAPALPSSMATIPPIDVRGAKSVDVSFTQGMEEGEPPLGINGLAYPEAPLVLHAAVGETQVWNLANLTDYDHPFHLHGFRFQVLTTDGKANTRREWKDTLNLPARGRATVAVHFDDRPGMWMVHCHILDHAKMGMMGMLHVH